MARSKHARVRTGVAFGAVLAAVLAGTTGAQAVDGSDEGANPAYTFVARLQVGASPGVACSGILVAAQWVLTEKSCFAAGGQLPVTGAPATPATATVGRTDLATTAGHVLAITWLVPDPDRDVLLARLDTRVTDIAPARLATTAPQPGDQVRAVGFGRTHTDWVPDRLHGGDLTVGETGAATLALTPVADGSAVVCKGDAGGPAVRAAGDGIEVVGLHHASGQLHCTGTSGGTADVIDTRIDDLGPWIAANTRTTCNATVGGLAADTGTAGLLPDFTGDCAADIIGQNAAGSLLGFVGSGVLSDDTSLFTGSSVPVIAGNWNQTQMPRILLGDFTGDGRTDLIGQNAANQLIGAASTGDNSAANRLFPVTHIVGQGFTTTGVPRLLAGDFNGDGLTDVAGGRADGSITVWQSTGNLGVERALLGAHAEETKIGSTPLGLTTAAYPRMFTADLNGDGRADIVAQAADGSLWVYPSTGDLSGNDLLFAPRVAIGSGWTAANIPRILSGDFNGDGITDLAAVRANGTLSVWTSSGDLSGAKPVLQVAGQNTTTPALTVAAYPRLLAGDLDHDGRTDFLANTTAGKMRGWKSSGDTSPAGRMFPGELSKDKASGYTTSGYPRIF